MQPPRPLLRLAVGACLPANIRVKVKPNLLFADDAVLDGKTVVVSNPAVPVPTAMRYGFVNAPDMNLFNADGLPASPFRTDVD